MSSAPPPTQTPVTDRKRHHSNLPDQEQVDASGQVPGRPDPGLMTSTIRQPDFMQETDVESPGLGSGPNRDDRREDFQPNGEMRQVVDADSHGTASLKRKRAEEGDMADAAELESGDAAPFSLTPAEASEAADAAAPAAELDIGVVAPSSLAPAQASETAAAAAPAAELANGGTATDLTLAEASETAADAAAPAAELDIGVVAPSSLAPAQA